MYFRIDKQRQATDNDRDDDSIKYIWCPNIAPMTQPELQCAERGYYATVAAVGGGLEQFPSDTVSFRSATSCRFGLHLGKQSSNFIDRHAFSSRHILLVLLRGCDFGCNVYELRTTADSDFLARVRA